MATAILLEDNYFNRDIARTVLEQVGYAVTEVVNGQEGLDILADQTFDLMVIDLQMPIINGPDVIHRVRKDKRHNNMTILVSTANPHMIDEVLQEYVDFIINKPFSVHDFGQLCERIRDSRQHID